LREECVELKNRYSNQKARLETLCKELCVKEWNRTWKSDKSEGRYVDECYEKLMVEFTNIIPKELPKVGARVDTLKGELSELRPISTNERQKIEELIEKKKTGETELVSIKNSLKDIESQIEYNQKQLDDGTNDMLDTINRHFSDLMDSLGYAGMVQKILTDDNKNGLKILVKYRATEDLAQLSFNAQSGGEKSVATALYIIALQEMTQVPFR
jgi:chromosome segregation ATPase